MMNLLLIVTFILSSYAILARANDVPSTLFAPEEAMLLRTTTGFQYKVEGVEYLFQGKSTKSEIVRVDVFSRLGNGDLSLNEEYKYLAHFKSCTLNKNWCSEDNGNITFTARKIDVNNILANITFQLKHPILNGRIEPSTSDMGEQILIRVYEGGNISCFPEVNSVENTADGIAQNPCTFLQGVTNIPQQEHTQLLIQVDKKRPHASYRHDDRHGTMRQILHYLLVPLIYMCNNPVLLKVFLMLLFILLIYFTNENFKRKRICEQIFMTPLENEEENNEMYEV